MRTDPFSNIVADREFRLVVTHLQFPIQVCFSMLSVCRPRPASLAATRTSVTDNVVVLIIVMITS